MTSSQNLWVKFARFPPVLVRLLARNGSGGWSEDGDLIGLLSLAEIKRLSYSTSWDEITVRQMQLFLGACGIDFADSNQMRILNQYLTNRPKFAHITSDYGKELLLIYVNHLRR
jgi:hypothetical protein